MKLKPFLRLQLITFLYNSARISHPVHADADSENHLPDNAFGILFATMALGTSYSHLLGPHER